MGVKGFDRDFVTQVACRGLEWLASLIIYSKTVCGNTYALAA